MRSLTLLAVLLPSFAWAESPHPLRLVPTDANIVLRVDQPRAAVETVVGLDLFQQMQTLPFVREQVQSPAVQRVLQLIRYYEKDLGRPWPELLGGLAGRGVTLATSGGENAPVLLVLDGTDEPLTERFLKRALELLEQELAREESKERIEKATYRGITGYKIGDARFARIGATLLVANHKDAMKKAIDLNFGEGKSLASMPGPDAARRSLPAECLAWGYLNLDIARKSSEAEATFALPSNNPLQLFALGGWLNSVKRAPYAALGVTREREGFHLTLKFPNGGRNGLPPALVLHVPPKDAPPAPPLLQPRRVIFSHRFWFDFHALYTHRAGLFNEQIAKSFEDGEKQIRKFLLGRSLADLTGQAGAWHRVVIAHPEKIGYRVTPGTYFPAFAFINTMRDPAMAKPFSGILRGIALTAGQPYKPRLVEETHAGIEINGYRFPEDRAVPDDPENARFNFSPCFATVGDQFIMCSTIEFCREIIDLLQAESANPNRTASAPPLHGRLYASGGVELLRRIEDQVLGQIVLDQAIAPTQAREQVTQLFDWVRCLGTLEFQSNYLDDELRFTVEWKLK